MCVLFIIAIFQCHIHFAGITKRKHTVFELEKRLCGHNGSFEERFTGKTDPSWRSWGIRDDVDLLLLLLEN